MNNQHLHTAQDGITRCCWCSDEPDYINYHDQEWGRPVVDDILIFEKICLEGFQSGLSWLTILRKRKNFRKAFAGFDFYKITEFDENHIEILLQNSGIIRHRGKIEATINNAHRALEVVEEFGSLASYIWGWEPESPEPHLGKDICSYPIPAITKTSKLLSEDLKTRGWKFFGPTTAYAFMQAMGLVNDHIEGCAIRKSVVELGSEFLNPSQHFYGNA